MSDASGPVAPACVVQVTGLSKRFGEIEVLKDVDLSVVAGEKVAIIGPSGSGKTTLLRCVAHLERPTTGHVEIAGERIGEKLVNGKWRTARSRGSGPASVWCSNASTCSRI